MITRIEIDGFKTFREFAVDLEPLTAIIGPNSAGKSNLFDALRLLSRLMTDDVATAFASGRGAGIDQFMQTASGRVDTIRFALELLLPVAVGDEQLTQTRLRYELSIKREALTSGVEDLHVSSERLSPIVASADAWAHRHPKLQPWIRYGSQTEDYLKLDLIMAEGPAHLYAGRGGVIRDTSGSSAVMLKRERGRTVLSMVGASARPHVATVLDHLRTLRLLHLGGRIPHRSDVVSTQLKEDASNLPTAIAASPAVIGRSIVADLVELVPGIRDLEVISDKEQGLFVEVLHVDGRRIQQRLLSDGTLNVLAFLTMLRTAAPGSTIAHEEPENGVFPGRLRSLIEKAREVTDVTNDLPVQVIWNSHAPTLLAALKHDPSAIVFADLVRGPDGLRRTRMRHVESGTRGASTVSIKEIDRILETARPEEAA